MKTTPVSIPHPSAGLSPELVTLLRRTAPEAEQQGLLVPEQLEIIYQQQWFNLLAPSRYGGLELSLPDVLKMEESLAWADGSLGWTVTLCTGAAWFGGFLHPDKALQVFGNPKACLAGSGAVSGTATETADGYIINGKWKYASGAHHATYFTANCAIERDGKPVLTPTGEPLVRAFIIPQHQVNLVPTWKYVGMMGTGSHGFEIVNAEVPKEACFQIAPEGAVIQAPLYTYPFLQLAEATTAINLSGMAMRFIELCDPIFTQKAANGRITPHQQEILKAELEAATAEMNDARHTFFSAVDASWQQPEQQELLNKVSSTSLQLAHTARECIDQLYPYCGLQAASPDTEINQVWRNFHTASQHALLTFSE